MNIGMAVAVNASITLLQPRRIPRQIEVDEVAAPGLQVDALASSVGAEQDAQRLLGP